MKNTILPLCALSLALDAQSQNTLHFSEEAVDFIQVNASRVEQRITPWLYGACIEDVNHEIYGGLYDQKIFGESFEEPLPTPKFDNLSIYDGYWEGQGDEISVRAHSGAKLVYDPRTLRTGSVETELKFTGNQGDNAGLLIRVASPGRGADAFYGYEISLAANGRKVVIGKHKNNFTPVSEVPVSCNPAEWNRLKVCMEKGKIKVLLNGATVFQCEDADTDLAEGKVALRTWNSDVRFRNFKITETNAIESIAFHSQPVIPVSRQWTPVRTGDAQSRYTLDLNGAFNGRQCQLMEMISGEGTVGISNSGLNGWGIAVRKGQKFQGRLYLKTPDSHCRMWVALQSADGQKEYAVQEISGLASQWTKHPFELTSKAKDPQARFAVYMDRPGKVWIDQVTLMQTGNDQFKGLPFRNDIGTAMVNQGLTFLRYGGTMINAPEYRFKKMIGDPDRRPPYRGHWYTYSTNGFGIEEFVKFCEAANFTAAFAVNIEEDPQDMADMVEYLTGATTSEWGKKRAENGHPAPYRIEYIGIGNEEVLFHGDNAEEYDHYIKRFHLLHDAIKSKNPSIKLVNTAWWRPESPSIEKVFRALDGKADYWDYHPWADQLTSGKEVEAELRRMKEMFLQWNPNTTMKCAIFEENGNSHNIQRMLGHVTLQNAVRRMGDFVLTSCAANALQPYRQNDNGWDQGQIFFTPSQVWGMPPYYAQQVASKYHQPLLVHCESGKVLDVTATLSEDGQCLVMHVANTTAQTVRVNLSINHFGEIVSARSITLSGQLEDVNTPESPERIVPVEQKMEKAPHQEYRILPYSYTVLIFDKR